MLPVRFQGSVNRRLPQSRRSEHFHAEAVRHIERRRPCVQVGAPALPECVDGFSDEPCVGKHVVAGQAHDHRIVRQAVRCDQKAPEHIVQRPAHGRHGERLGRPHQRIVARVIGRGDHDVPAGIPYPQGGQNRRRNSADGQQALAGQAVRRHTGLNDNAHRRQCLRPLPKSHNRAPDLPAGLAYDVQHGIDRALLLCDRKPWVQR